MIWLTKIKAYWSILVGLLVGGLALTVKVLAGSNRRLRKDAKEAEAQRDHIEKVMERDAEIRLEHDVRTEELRDDIKNKRRVRELSDPNDW